jgi:hypothetical protein
MGSLAGKMAVMTGASKGSGIARDSTIRAEAT